MFRNIEEYTKIVIMNFITKCPILIFHSMKIFTNGSIYKNMYIINFFVVDMDTIHIDYF
jgi:hypothetical protein